MSAPALLEARGVSVAHGARQVLRPVTLSLPAGACVALVGPNGAGKSTLVRALSGAQRLQSGSVLLDGLPLPSLPGDVRGRRLAVVPQGGRRDLPFTVRQMVGLGRAPHRDGRGGSPHEAARVAWAMEAAEVAALGDRPFTSLSGGEQQRVLLARALAQEAAVLLLDEPTAHQDPGHQLLVLERVREHTAAGGAALVVLHDLALAARLDRVVVLRDGELVEDGPPAVALSPARLRSVFGIDGAVEDDGTGAVLRLRGRS